MCYHYDYGIIIIIDYYHMAEWFEGQVYFDDLLAAILRKMILVLLIKDRFLAIGRKFGKFARAKGTVRRYALQGPADSPSPCSGWCHPISMCTPSLTWKLLASLSLGSASTRRSPATSGRCWACRQLAMVAVKGARWQGTGRGYMVSSVLRSAPAQTCARSGRGQQCDPHFQTLLSTD